MRHLLLIICLLAIAALHTDRASAQYGTELPFTVGSNARVSSLGVAGTTLLGDASVQYYNPASPSRLQWKQASFYRSELYDSRSTYHALSYAHPLVYHGTLAFSILRVGVGGIEHRSDANQLLDADLEDSQTRILLGYARNLGSGISVGVNGKIDNHSFGEYSGSGVGLDLGILATQDTPELGFLTGLRQGVVIHNLIEPSIKLDQESVADPMNVSVGLSAMTAASHLNMVTSLDLVKPRYSPLGVRFGHEFTLMESYSLRIGVDDGTATYGFGAIFRTAALDYAYRSEDLGNNHRISLSLRFGHSRDESLARDRRRLEAEVNEKIGERMSELERSQIEAAIAKGDSLFDASDYAQATAHYETALLWDPDNQDALTGQTQSRYRIETLLAQDDIEAGNYVEGLFHAQQALEHVPADSLAQHQAQLCSDEIASANDTAHLLNELLRTGIDFYTQGEFATALSRFDDALKIDTSNQFAREYSQKCHINIEQTIHGNILEARELAKHGNYDDAIRLLGETLKLKGGDKTIIGEIELAKSKQQEAIAEAQRMTTAPSTTQRAGNDIPAVDPAILEPQYNQGMKHFNSGDFDQAIEAFLGVWRLDPEFDGIVAILTKAYLLEGMTAYSDHDYVEAIRVWERALAIDPNNSKVRRYLKNASQEFQMLSDARDP